MPSINHNSRILITGGAGFIGSHLAEYLLTLDARVTILDPLEDHSNITHILPAIQFVKGNLIDQLLQGFELADYDFIFHLAGNNFVPRSVENPVYDFDANLGCTFALLESLRALKTPPRLINMSSGAVYGNPQRIPICEDDPTLPISPYGVSKLAAERYTAVYSQIYGLQTLSLRVFSTYGPRQKKLAVYELLHRLKQKPHRLEVIGNGQQARDFIYVSDVVQALVKAACHSPAKGEVYNTASGKSTSIQELVDLWCHLTGLNPEIVYLGKIRPGEPERWQVDISHLTQLGFTPLISLEEGLKYVLEWYEANL